MVLIVCNTFYNLKRANSNGYKVMTNLKNTSFFQVKCLWLNKYETCLLRKKKNQTIVSSEEKLMKQR